MMNQAVSGKEQRRGSGLTWQSELIGRQSASRAAAAAHNIPVPAGATGKPGAGRRETQNSAVRGLRKMETIQPENQRSPPVNMNGQPSGVFIMKSMATNYSIFSDPHQHQPNEEEPQETLSYSQTFQKLKSKWKSMEDLDAPDEPPPRAASKTLPRKQKSVEPSTRAETQPKQTLNNGGGILKWKEPPPIKIIEKTKTENTSAPSQTTAQYTNSGVGSGKQIHKDTVTTTNSMPGKTIGMYGNGTSNNAGVKQSFVKANGSSNNNAPAADRKARYLKLQSLSLSRWKSLPDVEIIERIEGESKEKNIPLAVNGGVQNGVEKKEGRGAQERNYGVTQKPISINGGIENGVKKVEKKWSVAMNGNLNGDGNSAMNGRNLSTVKVKTRNASFGINDKIVVKGENGEVTIKEKRFEVKPGNVRNTNGWATRKVEDEVPSLSSSSSSEDSEPGPHLSRPPHGTVTALSANSHNTQLNQNTTLSPSSDQGFPTLNNNTKHSANNNNNNNTLTKTNNETSNAEIALGGSKDTPEKGVIEMETENPHKSRIDLIKAELLARKKELERQEKVFGGKNDKGGNITVEEKESIRKVDSNTYKATSTLRLQGTTPVNHHDDDDAPNLTAYNLNKRRGSAPGAVKTDSHDEGQEVKEEANKVLLLPQNRPVAPPIVPPIDQADGLNIDPADEVVTDRVTMKQWDPSKLLADMYALKLAHDADEEVGSEDVRMEGIMEKLPMNKKKATLLKTWKRRFFRAAEGNLYYFENSQMDKPSSYLQLGGGHIDDLGQRLLGIDDGRGRYLVVRVPHEKDFDNWKRALESQTVDDARRKFVKPVLKSIPNTRKKVVIIDIGSCSIRAGLLGEEASLPQLFFPNIVATDKSTGKKYYGIDAYTPAVRSRCRISYPVRGSSRVDKGIVRAFTMDTEEMPGLFMKIFTDLKIDPSEYWVLVSVPQNLSMSTQEEFMKVLVNKFNVVGVNIHNQSLLSLYSYQAMSGIVIDIGERMEIVPITEGYIVEGGVARQPYGGHKVATVLNSMLTENENKYHFFTDVEFLLVRHVMEKTCYVCEDYKEEVKVYEQNPREFVQNVDLKGYDLPQGTYTNVSHDVSRFKCPEGMFKTDLWGMDVPKIQKQVLKAIQSCPMDFRREMYRSVYLSGGTTLLPGFPERIQREIAKVAPPSVVVQVHASPQRYHAAYIGACTLANLAAFEQASISREEWRKSGPISLKKWQMYWH